MSHTPIAAPALNNKELEQLDLLLERFASDGAADSSMLHGMFCAMALVPQAVTQAQWLEAALGNPPPEPCPPELCGQLMPLMLRLQNEVFQTLHADDADDCFLPILMLDEDDNPDCRPWCQGFVLGMSLFDDALWQGYFEQEQMADLLTVILALTSPDTTAELQKTLPPDVAVQSAMAEELPAMLLDLRDLIRELNPRQ